MTQSNSKTEVARVNFHTVRPSRARCAKVAVQNDNVENEERPITTARAAVSGEKAISASDGRMTASPKVALGEDNEQPCASEKERDHTVCADGRAFRKSRSRVARRHRLHGH